MQLIGKFVFFWLILFGLSCQTKQTAPELTTTIITDTLPIAQPKAILPAEPIPFDYDTTKWTELIRLDNDFHLNLKYATTDNFVKVQLYDCPRCFLRPEAARALQLVKQQLQRENLGLMLFDCYRPRPVQQHLWDIMPNASYVTPPKRGSMHNRGLAVDLTLTDSFGNELDMGTPFDFFGKRGHHTFTDLPPEILNRRIKLKTIMADHGFRSIRTEWWHYNYRLPGQELSDWRWNCAVETEETPRNN